MDQYTNKPVLPTKTGFLLFRARKRRRESRQRPIIFHGVKLKHSSLVKKRPTLTLVLSKTLNQIPHANPDPPTAINSFTLIQIRWHISSPSIMEHQRLFPTIYKCTHWSNVSFFYFFSLLFGEWPTHDIPSWNTHSTLISCFLKQSTFHHNRPKYSYKLWICTWK